MRIGVIGAGRLGISFALLCEKNGLEVIVSDIRKDYIDNLNEKKCLTNEPLIQTMLSNTKNFSATTDNLEVIKNSDLIFTFVATPSKIKGNYDITNVYKVAEDFHLASKNSIDVNGKKLVIGCTTNPGDTELIQRLLTKLGVKVAYNPEFIAQGEIVKGLEQADIILIGTTHSDLIDQLVNIYEKIQTTTVIPKIMSPKAAEVTKIGINCFLTSKISFANMMGDIMVKAKLEDEINVVLDAIGGDSRVGKKYMKYGFGFGGPCLPRDNRALGHFASSLGLKLNLPLTVDSFNKEHAEFLKNYYIQKNPDKSVPFIMDYVSYKKGTDILEESQQYKLCNDLLEEGYNVYVLEINEISEKLSSIKKYDGRLQFFPQGTNLDGVLINI